MSFGEFEGTIGNMAGGLPLLFITLTEVMISELLAVLTIQSNLPCA
jgi:hypothetical protein